jgi:GMP synthase (glutamine-hydrolysing)
MSNSVLIIDFGSQVTQLIARRVREFGVYSEIKNPDLTLDGIKKLEPQAIIFSGGPASVYEQNAPTIDPKIFDLGIPILGICYGQQLICHLLGGKVGKAAEREFGKAEIEITGESQLLDGIAQKQVWMSHGDRVEKIPATFKTIAKTDSAPFAAIADEAKKNLRFAVSS